MNPVNYRIVKIKTGDKCRDITIYAPEEIIAQHALLRQIQTRLETGIHPCAFGYRKGGSNWTAAKCIQQSIQYYKHYVKCDIKSFFTSIDRTWLQNRLESILPKSQVQEIMRYVTCCSTGIAQGSPLSPIISNIYLSEVDQALGALPFTCYFRYADDILFLTKLPEKALSTLKQSLFDVCLCMNDDKTRIGVASEGFSFIGLDFQNYSIYVSRESQADFCQRMAVAPERKRKAMMQGFAAYFRDVQYLHPDENFLYWMKRYAQASQTAAYRDLFPETGLKNATCRS